MKKFNETAGIDVSKHTIDVYLHKAKEHKQFVNNKKGFIALLKWLKNKADLPTEHILFCFEHTGLYSFPLASFLSEKKAHFSMVSGLEIKRSIGLTRGKNDKIDAQRIAEYAYLKRTKLKENSSVSKELVQLGRLLSLRERMVVQRAGYQTSLNEYRSFFNQEDHPELFKAQEQMIIHLKEQIDMLEKKIYQVIQEDDTMNSLFKLITSVKGIGLILATHFLLTTNRFTLFDDSRKYACYCGIAPFEKQSGISIKSKSRVSHYANKRVKALLHLAASSAIQFDPELKSYYQRRIKEGKSKMSTINIVRNKLVYRVFAVVKRQSPYTILNKHAA